MAQTAIYIDYTEGSTPSTPASTHWRLYFKSDGLYFVDDAGTEYGPLPTSALSNPMSAIGDTIVGGSSGTPTRQVNNLSATAAPDADNDTTEGYKVGSVWIDTTNDKAYVCLDNTDTAAVWTETTQAGGEILATHAYAAGSDTVLHTQGTATLTDVDATNAAITFTAPSSGNVLVRVSALEARSGSGSTHWGIREGSSTIAEAFVLDGSATGIRNRAEFIVSGIAAGSHTYKFAHRSSSNNDVVYSGPANGQVILEVYDAG